MVKDIMQLHVNRIQRFCLQDGPGIRTTVFLQGCSLRCWWCHNPDTRPPSADRSSWWDIEALSDYCRRDQKYWLTSEGGLTVSGGEPLIQPEALAVFLEGFGKDGIDRCIETAGAVPWDYFEQVLPEVDRWLFDMKSCDPLKFKAQAKGDVRRPMDNLQRLLTETDVPVQVRIPVINGFNSAPDDLKAIGAFLAELPRAVTPIILPGHDLHVEDARIATISQETACAARDEIAHYNPKVEILW